MVEKKLEKYYWIGGVIAVTFIIFLLALFFIIIPSFKSIDKVSKELKGSKTELKVAETKLEKLKELKVKEEELKEQSRVVYRAIPTKKEVGDIFIQLNGLVSDAGGDSKKASGSSGSSSGASSSSQAQQSSGPAGVSTLTYTVDTTLPGYLSFKSLLATSEQALRFVHLDNIKIESKDSFTVTLTYKAYYRDQGSTQTEGVK